MPSIHLSHSQQDPLSAQSGYFQIRAKMRLKLFDSFGYSFVMWAKNRLFRLITLSKPTLSEIISFMNLVLLTATGSFSSPLARADTVVVVQDRGYHWSIADWLEQRDRMRLQDLWLSMHSGSPYEFYIGGNYQFNQLNSAQMFQAWEGSFAGFAGPFGLEARYESGSVQRAFGVFDLRLFGFHDQATNLTMQVGLRNEASSLKSFRNLFTGVSLTLYLTKYMGVEGLYRHFFPSTPNELGESVSGNRYQGGAFLVFFNTRVFLDYFSDLETNSITQGIVGGFRAYLQ